MNEQQWSIPSIHLAHPLQGSDSSANTSYAEHTEEDDSLLVSYDDSYDGASLSSHCSSLYRPDGEIAAAGDELLHLAPHQSLFPRHTRQPQVVMNPHNLMSEYTVTGQKDQSKDNDDADLSMNAVYDYGDRSLAVDRRKRKQRKREELAFEWLLSMQGSKHVVAEAASSKFLTGSVNRRRRRVVLEKELAAAATNVLGQSQVPLALREIATPAMLRRQALSLSAAS
jgi:hypothetical protein